MSPFVRPRTEQDADAFRRAAFAAMRQGTEPGEPKPTVTVPHGMTAHQIPCPEVPLILNGVAVTARKPDPAAWKWLLAAITHADSEAERTMRSMDLLAYTLDPDDMRRWQASGVHSGAEIKDAAGVVIRALRHDGEREVRELHDAAGRSVTRHVVHAVQGYLHDVAPILPPPEEPLVDWGKNEPVDAPVGRWFVVGWMFTVLLAVVGLCIGIASAPMPSEAKWIPMCAVLLAGFAVMFWCLRMWVAAPQVRAEDAELRAQDVAWCPLPDVFTAIAGCPVCKKVAAHALDAEHAGEGIGRVCECGYHWTQTGL